VAPQDKKKAAMEELQVDTQSLDESFAIPPVNEIDRIQVSLNKIAAMEELQVDTIT
jgi:hypothetical protein